MNEPLAGLCAAGNELAAFKVAGAATTGGLTEALREAHAELEGLARKFLRGKMTEVDHHRKEALWLARHAIRRELDRRGKW